MQQETGPMGAQNIGSDGALRCPGCDEESLHHHAVDVWACDSEDSEHMAVVNVRSGKAGKTDCFVGPAPAVNTCTLPRALIGGRRGAVEIHFYCESCNARPVLRVTQHKGLSLLSFTA